MQERYYSKSFKTKLPGLDGPGDPYMIDKINIKNEVIEEIIQHYDGFEIDKILYKKISNNSEEIVKKIKYRIPNEVLKTLEIKKGKTNGYIRVVLPEECIIKEEN